MDIYPARKYSREKHFGCPRNRQLDPNASGQPPNLPYPALGAYCALVL
ncbi:hypothetical protein CIPAW_08G020500 [Carya illinoinensis]|uniref:Uncharacterized protein n=1 Tax=Carya illinoinensis TaxID=32201 RepID=A0A8T1PUD5_CARIL|nr:hypothetical protein CIPAW_08G020500 [Carya illinoinensis]